MNTKMSSKPQSKTEPTATTGGTEVAKSRTKSGMTLSTGVTLEWGFDQPVPQHDPLNVRFQIAYLLARDDRKTHTYDFTVYKNDTPAIIAAMVKTLIDKEGMFGATRDPMSNEIKIDDVPRGSTYSLIESPAGPTPAEHPIPDTNSEYSAPLPICKLKARLK